MRRNLKSWLIVSLFLLVIAAAADAKTIYVDADAAGSGTGANWANAYPYLQDALADANTLPRPVEIRVAQGTYKPDEGAGVVDANRTETFQLINGVTLKGGYAGDGEADPDTRDVTAYETILSGDLLGNDSQVSDPGDLRHDPNRAENSYHVVTGSSTNETAILDGFTISDGNHRLRKPYPNDDESFGWGGGMYNYNGSPTVTGCTFMANYAVEGSGMYNYNGSPTVTDCTFNSNLGEDGTGIYSFEYSSPTITNCVFSGNVANSMGGGGIYNRQHSSPIVTNCTFNSNLATDGDGAGMHNEEYSSPTITDCAFTENWSDDCGGAMKNENSSNPVLTNCLFNGNRSGSGAGIGNFDSSPSLTNCTFIGNTAYEYHGGGMYNYFNSSPTLHNCTFSGNLADDYGAAIYNSSDSNAMVTNCIFWDNGNYDLHNCFATYSCLENGGPGIGNIDTDPCFVMPGYWDNNATPGFGSDDFWVDGDYHLLPESLCIDAGDPNYVAGPHETDLDGNPRVVNGRIDMGAYEYQEPTDCSGAYPSIGEIWPSNHKWVEVEILGVPDPDGDPIVITITGITQDEPVVGQGSSHTCPDGDGIGTSFARVRAERSGQGNGRVYEISFEAHDGSGSICNGTVQVCVPHDKGKGNACVDDGQIYDSTTSELLSADLTADGRVNTDDLDELSQNWLETIE